MCGLNENMHTTIFYKAPTSAGKKLEQTGGILSSPVRFLWNPWRTSIYLTINREVHLFAYLL